MNIKSLINQSMAISLGLTLCVTAIAGQYAAVTKEGCQRFQNSKDPFILILNPGDNLHESINHCADDAKLSAASISGLGQVQNPTLAYFTSNPNDKPELTTLNGFFELASLNGNITNNNGQHYTHMHGTLADHEFKGIAGHIESATAGLTVEITIIPFAGPVERVVNDDTGFGPISTQ